MLKFGIIGPRGAKESTEFVNAHNYLAMVKMNGAIIDHYLREKDTDEFCIVSGGAAFADHSAVSLWLQLRKEGFTPELHLHLPCPFDLEDKRYKGVPGNKPSASTANTANYWHMKFSSALGSKERRSLETLALVLEDPYCKVRTYDGFFDRNIYVGDVDVLFAHCIDDNPPIGGTGHTWHHSQAKVKVHFPIGIFPKEVDLSKLPELSNA